jgi:hypothetical protein
MAKANLILIANFVVAKMVSGQSQSFLQKKEIKNRPLQRFIGFYCWLRVSAFGKSVIRPLKMYVKIDNLNTASYNNFKFKLTFYVHIFNCLMTAFAKAETCSQQ